MGGGSSAFLSFEEFQKARKIIDERGKLDSNAELLSRVKEALASPQPEIDSLSETPIVLAMKSPKAASRQTPKAGAGGVFFNQHEEEVRVGRGWGGRDEGRGDGGWCGCHRQKSTDYNYYY